MFSSPFNILKRYKLIQFNLGRNSSEYNISQNPEIQNINRKDIGDGTFWNESVDSLH